MRYTVTPWDEYFEAHCPVCDRYGIEDTEQRARDWATRHHHAVHVVDSTS